MSEETLREYIDREMRMSLGKALEEEHQRWARENLYGSMSGRPLGLLNSPRVMRFVNGPLHAERPPRIERAVNHARQAAKDEAGDKTWFRWSPVNKKSDGKVEAEVYIYDEIGYWGVTAADFVDSLNEVAAGATHITVRINSPGGEVFDGIAIGNALREHSAHVTAKIDGLAASAASFIAAMAGDTVVMGAFAQMMIHDASGLAIGNAGDMREMATMLDRISDNIALTYAAKAGGSRDEWRSRMKVETWYDGPEAVAAGLADQALSPEDDPSGDAAKDAAARFDLSNFAYPGGRPTAPPPKAVDTTKSETPFEDVSIPTFDPAELRALMEQAAVPAGAPDGDIIRAGIELAFKNAPAPATKPEEPVAPVVLDATFRPIDPSDFYNAIRKAVL